MLAKLNHYGIRGIPLEWLKSYLAHRKQVVLYDTVSSEKEITCGVWQGSILGPLLYFIYINDLAQITTKAFSVLFVDDTNLFVAGKNLLELYDIMNSELINVLKWLKVNKLSLNIHNTHIVLLNKNKPRHNVSIKIDSHEIDKTTHTKF